MEFFTIFLSSLIGLVSPTGFAVERVAESAIRSQFKQVEQLQVRLDNAPTHQLLQGRAERIRIAGRGLFPSPEFRIEALELETDPIDVDVQAIRRRGTKRGVPLDQPLQAGVHLVLTQADLNQALQSLKVAQQLRNLGIGLLQSSSESRRARRYELLNPRVTFLGNNRLRLEAELKERGFPDLLAIRVETGLAMVAGRQPMLVDPAILLNGDPVSPRVLQGISEGVRDRFDLSRLVPPEMTARVLQLKIDAEKLDVAAFVQLNPQSNAAVKVPAN